MRPHEVALLRIVAQRLAGPRCASPADAVRLLTAVQAQEFRGAVTSVALRTAQGTAAAVEAALDAGEVVRSWPMRGTLHLVAAEDLGWLLDLTAAHVVARTGPRHAELDIDTALLERARELTVDALGGGRCLARSALLGVWEGAGIATGGQRGYHLLVHLAQTGTVCGGPVGAGREPEFVLVDEWVRAPRRLERDEALAELCLRYLRGHGPATAKDLAAWTKLPAADVRTGLGAARPRLEEVDVDGVEHLLDPATPALLDAHRAEAQGVFLLPGFDEFVLGYRDRSAVLAPEFAERICPGRNGVFASTVVADGRIVGTWKRPPRTDPGPATAFTSFPPDVERAVAERLAAVP